MAQRWLVKTEPSVYSFQRLQQERRTVWDGVVNPLALKHLSQMRRGDHVVVYHTGNEKAAVGLAHVVKDAYPDPTRKSDKLVVVDLAADRPLARSVSLAEIKADPRFADFELVRLPRLSVVPMSAAHWSALEALSKTER